MSDQDYSGLVGTLSASPAEKPPTLDQPAKNSVGLNEHYPWAEELFIGSRSDAGVNVSVRQAVQVMAVVACCRVIAEGVAQLPIGLFQPTEDGRWREPVLRHPALKLLRRRPNEVQTPFGFRETMIWHVMLFGRFVAWINRAADGRPLELIPLLPGQYHCDTRNITNHQWSVQFDGNLVPVKRNQIFEVSGPQITFGCPIDPLFIARNVLGLAIATERTHSLLHRNSARVGGILTLDGQLSPEGKERMREGFLNRFQSQNEQFGVVVLDINTKFHQLTMSGVDSEHIETRRLQIEEVCRWARVFPAMIMQSEKNQSNASSTQFFRQHATHSLSPYCDRFTQAAYRDLLSREEQDDEWEFELDMSKMIRGDAQARGQYYKDLAEVGAIAPNEVRIREGLRPMKGLDEPTRPLNRSAGTEQESEDDNDDDQISED